MSEEDTSRESTEQEAEELQEPSPEKAEELLENSGMVAGLIRKHPEMLQGLAAGYRAIREGFGDFLTANDRGADRVKDTADKVISTVENELAREGLTPDERYRLIEAEERVLGQVRGNEKDVREANERSFGKVAAITSSLAVGAVALAYLAKEGKLPPISPARL